MKKAISILLIVAMMLATVLAIIPASAAQSGTAIRTEADFAAMKGDGEYYLANDISLTKSYETTFAGTLDGNGKTVTVKDAIPIFKNIAGGKISNLNINTSFEVEKPNGDFGALARTAHGTFEGINAEINFVFTAEATANNIGGLFALVNGKTDIYNVVVSGSIKHQIDNNSTNNSQQGIGGFIGAINTDKEVIIGSSINYADVCSGPSVTCVGGFVGASNGKTKLTLDNCQNYGDIDSNITTKDSSHVHTGAGGILGAANSNSQVDAMLIVTDCRNYGDVKGHGTGTGTLNCMMGGIVGRLYGAASVDITGCVNSGTVTNRSFGWDSAGGIVGYAGTYNFTWSTVSAAKVKIESCVNIGAISNAMYNGGILGSGLQFNSPNTEIEITRCANYANISATSNSLSAVGGVIGMVGNGGAPKLTVSNCYNSGSAKSGIVCNVASAWEPGGTADPELIGEKEINGTIIATTPYPIGNITNCVNEGTVTYGMISNYSYRSYSADYPMSDSKIKINSCVSNGELAPTGDVYVITAPSNANTVKTQVKSAVPGNPAELDVIIAKYKSHEAGDYTSGWATFESLYKLALEDANKAASQSTLDSHVARLTQASKSLVLKPVDLAPLNAAIADAEKLLTKEALYTPRTWAVFEELFANANDVLDRASALSSTVRASLVIKATENLKAAQAALELKPDKAQLTNAITRYSEYDESIYTSASWKLLADAIAAANVVKDDVNATKSDVDAAISAMNNAAHSLAEKVDPTPLKSYTTDLANKHKAAEFTAKSYNELVTLIRKVNEAVDRNDMSQAEMDDYLEQLNYAVAKLVVRGDFNEINAALSQVVDVNSDNAMEEMSYNYTPDSYKKFKAVVEKVMMAKREDRKPNFSVEDEEELLKEVNEAIAGLVPFANYTEIDAILAEVGKLDKNLFTAESWKAVEDAKNAINAIKSNRNTTQPEADAALANLRKAVEGLKTGDVSDMLNNIDPARLMEALIEAKNKYKPEDYTEASYKAFEEIVNTISAAMEEGELSEKEVKDYSKKLEKSIKELEKIVRKAENEEELSEALNELEDLDLLGCGGSISVTAIAMSVVLGLGSAVLFKKKRED